MLERSKLEGTTLRYGSMLEEFRDISSAREIPMFKGDQWELTVPALMQDDETATDATGPGSGSLLSSAEVAEGSPARPTKLAPRQSKSPHHPLGASTSKSASPAQGAVQGAAQAQGAGPSGSLDADLEEGDGADPLHGLQGLDGLQGDAALWGEEMHSQMQSQEAPDGGGRSRRLKGIPMCKSISHDLVSKVHKQMRRLQGHFLIAALSPLDDEEAATAAAWEQCAAAQPIVSHDVVNTRQAVLHFCQAQGLQFSSLR